MPHTDQRHITALLSDLRRGDRAALDDLYLLVEEELRRRAHHYLLHERSNHTLSTTALVHETYLKLTDMTHLEWQDRAHFFAIAATAMRRILVSYARMHNAEKRWGKQVRVSLDDAPLVAGDRMEEILAIDQALAGLAALNPRLSQTVELRFFGGLTIEETAEVLDVAPSTVKLYWMKARAWLYREIQG